MSCLAHGRLYLGIMHLTRLTLANFRNYADLELPLSPGLTLIQGNNACGKTNLLEAIFYLATAHSPHAGVERELVRWGASEQVIPFARVEAQVVRRNDVRTSLEIVLVQASGETAGDKKPSNRVSKKIKVNGVAKRAIDLLGNLNVVLFLPEDLDLVFGSPSDRRRYLDTTLSQIDPRYGRALSKYNQVVEQRNSLLKEGRERKIKSDELEVWDDQLIAEGSYLIERRASTIARYDQFVAAIHPRLTDTHEKLQLLYQPNVPLEASDADATEIAARFKKQLATMRPRELGAALTLVGPHRDDLRFLVRRDGAEETSMDAITYASRGQGRTIALSLKLAEVELMRAETGENPVLLLDDVMSELDAERRAALSQTVIDAPQAIITATDLADFSEEFLARARVLCASDGKIN